MAVRVQIVAELLVVEVIVEVLVVEVVLVQYLWWEDYK